MQILAISMIRVKIPLARSTLLVTVRTTQWRKLFIITKLMELSKFLGQSNHQLDDTVLPLNGVWTRRFNLYCNSFSIRDQIVTWPQWNIELAGNGVIRIVCSASRRSCRVQTWLTRSLFFLLSLSLSLSLSLFYFPSSLFLLLSRIFT